MAGRRLGRRVLVVTDRIERGASVRDGVAALADAGWAVTVAAGDPDDLGRLGVGVTDGDAASHLRQAPVLYDAVVVAVPDERPDLWPLLGETQRQALVASTGPAADGGRAVALAPDRTGTWPAALDDALRAKLRATRSSA
jgi:hypothetical protein